MHQWLTHLPWKCSVHPDWRWKIQVQGRLNFLLFCTWKTKKLSEGEVGFFFISAQTNSLNFFHSSWPSSRSVIKSLCLNTPQPEMATEVKGVSKSNKHTIRIQFKSSSMFQAKTPPHLVHLSFEYSHPFTSYNLIHTEFGNTISFDQSETAFKLKDLTWDLISLRCHKWWIQFLSFRENVWNMCKLMSLPCLLPSVRMGTVVMERSAKSIQTLMEFPP